MNILLDYDEVSGEISSKGVHIAYWVGLQHAEHKGDTPKDTPKDSLSDLIKLKSMGINTKDIIELNKAGLLK